MSWKRHVQAVPQGAKLKAAIERLHTNLDSQATSGSANKFASYLPEVYAGQPNRVERYGQFENMDRDPEVAGSLDTVADFGTQSEEQEDTMFKFILRGEPTDAEVDILNAALLKWTKLNRFKERLWRIFRSTTMYGDQFFVRDPETFEWHWVNHEKVESIIANEADGKKPDQYIIKDMDLNIQTLVATLPTKNPNRGFSGWAGTSRNAGPVAGVNGIGAASGTNRFEVGQTSSVVDAEHVIHLSMTEGLDANWPFGNSILESVFKPFKQKELLEDSIIIYRVQRAPERRVFYIDVGNAPPHKAMEFVNRIKNEIHQRRIPTQSGGGTSMMDAAYNPLCLALDTTVPLLDGRTLTINDLIEEYKTGKENWTYSCDPITGKVVPGNITWAGVTRKNTQVIKLHLDDGSSVTLTPDHKVPVLGKGFVEAQYLTENDSLISYKTKEQSLVSSTSDRTYTQVYDHSINEYKYTHRVVGEFFKDKQKHQEFTYLEENLNSVKNVVHHKDFNRYNNDPRNLQWMNKDDHFKFHSETNYWNNASPEAIENSKEKIANTLKLKWKDAAFREENVKNILSAQKKAVWLRNNDPKTQASYKENASKSRKLFMKNNPDFLTDVLMPNLSTWQENYPNQLKEYTFEQLQAVYDLANANEFKLKYMLTDTVNHNKLLTEIKKVNPPKDGQHFKIKTDAITQQVIYNTIRHFGYKNWMDFKRKKEEFNHRVVKIEWLDEKQDTGTITIDGNERWHNHHTFPVNNSIFVKNSIIEDYFFPQTADGKGSKVDTLPGGDNLGEIDDLKYFNNKLLRGLRVPSSYLPYGPEDGSQSYNDGRVGTAYMQEFRFGKYVKRLQNLLNPTFDREFKIFLRHRGISIDAGMFEVELHEPQNFSKYRQMEIDAAQISVWQPLSEVPYLAKRFVMERYLNMTEAEIIENERMWQEENPDLVREMGGEVGAAPGGGLGDVGITPEEGGGDDFDAGEIGDGAEGAEGDEGIDSPISGTDDDAPEGDLEL